MLACGANVAVVEFVATAGDANSRFLHLVVTRGLKYNISSMDPMLSKGNNKHCSYHYQLNVSHATRVVVNVANLSNVNTM